MIVTIGLIIAAYVFVRCLEMLATVDRIPNKANRVIVSVFAVLVVLVALGGGIDLAMSGSQASAELSRPQFRLP